MGTIKADLAGTDRELIETHASWVFVGPRDVYKVKRPVFLGFLDFRTLDRRKKACDAEVELNRRLAPDVYLGVVAVTRDATGRHRFGGPGEAVDWAVHMVRLPDDARADHRLADGRLTAGDVDRIAIHLAAFHAAARADEHTAAFGTTESIATNVRENFDQTREHITRYLTRAEADEIERHQLGCLERDRTLFARRCASGRVRDGHGDLRLEHVYLIDGTPPVIIDCIEFNERFRYADICADIAFLSMDLAWHNRMDLAERFLATYAREANDYELYRLVDFYEGYRAYVRGKVASMLALDVSVDLAARRRAGREARRYYLLALATKRRSLLPPKLVAVGGTIASGKSTIAALLADELAAPVVGTDRTRKHLAGVTPNTPLPDAPWSGAYTPSATERVYEEVFRRARAVLESGRPAVIDASFRSHAQRAAAARLAEAAGVPFVFVECRAPRVALENRLRARAERPGVSDGRIEILDELLAAWEPVTELAPSAHVVLDTSLPIAESMAVLNRTLAAWPAGFTG